MDIHHVLYIYVSCEINKTVPHLISSSSCFLEFYVNWLIVGDILLNVFFVMHANHISLMIFVWTCDFNLENYLTSLTYTEYKHRYTHIHMLFVSVSIICGYVHCMKKQKPHCYFPSTVNSFKIVSQTSLLLWGFAIFIFPVNGSRCLTWTACAYKGSSPSDLHFMSSINAMWASSLETRRVNQLINIFLLFRS